MKKIFISISTVIITVSMLCITAFGAGGETVDFGDYASISYLNFYKLVAGDDGDYIRWVTSDSENNLYETAAQATDYGAGTVTYDRFYFYVYLKAPSVNDPSTLANIGSTACPFYSGNYVSARIRFRAAGIDEDTFRSSVVMRHSYSQGTFNWSSMPSVGELKVVGYGDTYTEYEAVISYKNTGSTITDFSCQFMFCFLNSEQTVLYDKIVVYEPCIYDYYFGNGSEPDAPIYNGHEELNSDIEKNENLENEIMENNQQGIEDYNASVQGLNMLLEGFDQALLAFSRLFEYIIYKFDWLYTLLSFGLGLGAIAFVLNLFNNLRRRN